MLKVLGGFFSGIVIFALAAWMLAGSLMFNETVSPFGVEETAARIQRNILALKDKGWANSGLRNPARSVNNNGANVLPVLLLEACSPDYSQPLLKDDTTRVLSILMPCTITVFKKQDGKTYIGTMNSALMGKLFGSKVAEIMEQVAKDQVQMLTFDPNKPAPELIRVRPGGGGSGGNVNDGC